jgi:broad specificity phosphatase PhoE
MAGTTRIHLVRHGTTLLNRQSRYRGRRDVPLDAGGWQDAWEAAAQLGGAPVAAVYASPLRRARDTARVIADATEIADVVDLPGLLNLDYGTWEGLTSDEAAEQDPVAYAAYRGYHPGTVCPDGESLDAAAERVLLSLRMIALLHPEREVAAVSHAVMVRLAIAAVTDAPRADWRRNLPNGSITVFDVTGDSVSLVSVPVPA